MSTFVFLFYSLVFCSEIRIASLDPASSQLLIALNLHNLVVTADDLSHSLPQLKDVATSSKGLVVDYEKLLQMRVSHVVAYDLGFTSLEPKLHQLEIDLILLKNQKVTDLVMNLESLNTRFQAKSNLYIQSIKEQIAALPKVQKNTSYVLQIDYSPNYVAGNNNYLDDGLKYCGLKNTVKTKGYPVWGKEEILKSQVDYVFIMSDVIKKHGKKTVTNYWLELVPGAKIKTIDADEFSRLTPSFLHSLQKLCDSLKP
ncbi:MAG: ABC transporter substrate-binding protein [Bdellovibrionales bacterium]|nr:ABC transporter substrate-binding protein [Bdellovibrionales bacterium]